MADENRVDEFMRLFTSHEARLRAFVMSLVANYADAEDVMQQANLTLWKKFGSYQLGTNFMAWAGRVVYLHAQQHRQKQARDKVQFGEAFLAAVAREGTREPFVDELGEREQALGDCLGKLRSEHRAMLLAWYDEDNTIERMSGRFNRSGQAIYSALSRIRRVVFDCVTERVGVKVRHGA